MSAHISLVGQSITLISPLSTVLDEEELCLDMLRLLPARHLSVLYEQLAADVVLV
jgi:hypothetical protein